MFAIKMIVDNYAACCCSHCVVVNIVMSFKVMMEHCFAKEFKTEEKSKLKKHLNKQSLVAR